MQIFLKRAREDFASLRGVEQAREAAKARGYQVHPKIKALKEQTG